MAAQTASSPGATNLQRGRRVYQAVCAECHGNNGKGDGPKALKMGFHPRNFSLGAFKCRCTASGELPTDEDLLRSVTQGLPGTPMVANDKKTAAEDLLAVVQYIKTFSARFARETAPRGIAIPPAPVRTDQSTAEGRQIYRLMQCWKCHGREGRGDGPAAAGLKDDWGQSIKPYNFTVLKMFKCGNSDADLYRTLHTGMNGSPMPSYDAALSYAREDFSDSTPFHSYWSDPQVRELADYVQKQPSGVEINTMSDAIRKELVDRRTWALVHYLRSLLESR